MREAASRIGPIDEYFFPYNRYCFQYFLGAGR